MTDLFWFAILPYISVVLFLVVTIVRYRMRSFSYSSLSSQFLENEQHFFCSYHGSSFRIFRYSIVWE